MVSKIQLELTIKEFNIIKKALVNYKGKVDFLKSKEDVSLEMAQRLIKEERLLTYLLDSIKEEL